MKKQLIIGGWIVVILVFGVTIIRPKIMDNMKKVKFEDETMGFVITSSSGVKSEDEFRENNLEEVTHLDIAYPGRYETLIDIEKCKQLESLEIGQVEYIKGKDMGDKGWIQQLEKELDSITKSCSKINSLMLIGVDEHFELENLEFLKNAKNLKELTLFYQPAKDYSAISEIPHLKKLFFKGCNIEKLNMLEGLTELESLWIKECDVLEAGQIVNLKSLKKLKLESVPLAGNAEQLEIIFENCPNIERLMISSQNEKLSNIEFLKAAKNLKELELNEQLAIDYSMIGECSQLKYLSLYKCDISEITMLSSLENLESLCLEGTKVSEAKDILELENLKELNISSTPLAENEEQVELIQNKFPEIEIQK